LHLGYNEDSANSQAQRDYERLERRKSRSETRIGDSPLLEEPQNESLIDVVNEDGVPMEDEVHEENIMVDEGSIKRIEELEDICKQLKADLDKCMHENEVLSKNNETLSKKNAELELALGKVSFKKEHYATHEQRLAFYTGLPNIGTVNAVLNLVRDSMMPWSAKHKLTLEEEFVLFCMKLRLNSPFQELGYRFGVSESTACRIFHKWLNILHEHLKDFIKWPGFQAREDATPMNFREIYGVKVAVIIDCFEVFIDRPDQLDARAITWSQYKHKNTIKYEIGISTRGAVIFISKGYTGRVSDKVLTNDCGILENLEPGDIVLADRGFTINELVLQKHAELALPAFTRGKNS
jgi:hypothetical protein